MSSNLQLTRIEQSWIVSLGKQSVAEIYLDHFHQVEEVVLFSESSPKIQLQVLHLAASHVKQYVKYRQSSVFGGLMIAEHRNTTLTNGDSHRLMSFQKIPEDVKRFDKETIEKAFRDLSINIIIAIHKTAENAIATALFQVGVKGLRYSVGRQQWFYSNEMRLDFTVSKPNHFIFWKFESIPSNRGWDLHIVPDYHPVMRGWKSVGIANGATDAYIRGNTIRNIYCPKASQADRHGKKFGTSWNHIKHPFYAVGRSVSISISTRNIRSKEGVDELVQFLRASLGLGKQYVEISGGFRAPMKCAHNRLLDINQLSPYPKADHTRRGGNTARGSEEHCVWAHRTLEAEGLLNKAHVPSWFTEEDWMKIYEGAEVHHGLF